MSPLLLYCLLIYYMAALAVYGSLCAGTPTPTSQTTTLYNRIFAVFWPILSCLTFTALVIHTVQGFRKTSPVSPEKKDEKISDKTLD